MKKLQKIALGLLVAATMLSFTDKPAAKATAPVAEKNTSIKGPLILANSNTLINGRSGSQLQTDFNGLTDSFYGGANLYMHWSLSSSGPWSTGQQAINTSNPYFYNFSLSFASGVTVYMFYSTGTGNTYPSGSASPIYSAVAP